MVRMLSTNPVTVVFLSAGVVFGVIHIMAPSLASQFDLFAVHRPPEQTIRASIAIKTSKTLEWNYDNDVSPGGAVAKGPGGQIPVAKKWIDRTTLIDIKYKTPIDVNSTADIMVNLQQEQIDHHYNEEIETNYSPKVRAIPQLDWPIVLRLEGLGLEWPVNDIPIKQGSPLPLCDHWTPRAKAAGDYILRFPLKDINHAAESSAFHFVSDDVHVTVNGVGHHVSDSDDVTLSLKVFKYGLPARWIDLGTAILCISSFITAILGPGWGKTLLKRFKKA